MGAGSSAEPRSPQDGDPVAGESQPGSPEGQTPNGAAATATAAPDGPEEDPGKRHSCSRAESRLAFFRAAQSTQSGKRKGLQTNLCSRSKNKRFHTRNKRSPRRMRPFD